MASFSKQLLLLACFALTLASAGAEIPESVKLAVRDLTESLRQSQRYENLRPHLTLETQRALRRWPSSHRNRLARLLASELTSKDARVTNFAPQDSQSGEVSLGQKTYSLRRTDAQWMLDLEAQLQELRPAMELLLALDRFDEALASGQTGDDLTPYLTRDSVEGLKAKKTSTEQLVDYQDSWKDLMLSDFKQTPGKSAELQFQSGNIKRTVHLRWEDSGWRVDLVPLLEKSSL